MTKKQVIYIAAPANNTSGGPESLFQLGKELQLRNQKVVFYFYGGNRMDIPEKFKVYGDFEVVDSIEDSSNNVLIVPETWINLLSEFKKIKKVIWWLSVDFYEYMTLDKVVSRFCIKYHVPQFLRGFAMLYKKNKGGWQEAEFLNEEILHLYNCEYVKEYLEKNGVSEKQMLFLAPPLSKEYFSVSKVKKENIIAYNPAKGYEYTQNIMQIMNVKRPDIKFVPIQNMTSEDVANLLNRAKLYLDLGFFPGPDRIPRQAVLTNTNVITSQDGTANNNIDTPIPSKYKFNKTDYENIVNEIINNIDFYENNVNDFEDFRKQVIFEKNNFSNEIDDLVKYIV
ncbi:hypothetical protein KNP65_03145 [Latilactobacillus curvatus]|uniref:hypothetical protein n=1 Tax=Latilactobacillus curvatus TaxID=28038 RepID=UPI002410DDB3|nr:hypothetical protein [Latilactobacillus curvatus]MDG2978934.1 hypothetical protein [Latilactobacillus curvatus]